MEKCAKKAKKLGKFCGFVGRSRAKKLSASGGLRPLTPLQGLCPWTPLALRARHGFRPPPKENLWIRPLGLYM